MSTNKIDRPNQISLFDENSSVVFHIGFHKSASTFLQKRVFPRLSINYLFLSGEYSTILEMVQAEANFSADLFRDQIADAITKSASQTTCDISVISQEALSGHPHGYKSVDPCVVAKNLREAFPKAKILICIRNQFDYLISLYTFRVALKGYEFRDFERFLDEEGELGLFDKLEYHKLIDTYVRLFGKKNVLVTAMEQLGDSQAEILSSLEEFLHVSVPAMDDSSPVNQSTKFLSALRFWFPLNRTFGGLLRSLRIITRRDSDPGSFKRLRFTYYKFKRILTGILNKVYAGSEKISIEKYHHYNALLYRYARSNSRLERITGQDFARFGYPTDSHYLESHRANASTE